MKKGIELSLIFILIIGAGIASIIFLSKNKNESNIEDNTTTTNTTVELIEEDYTRITSTTEVIEDVTTTTTTVTSNSTTTTTAKKSTSTTSTSKTTTSTTTTKMPKDPKEVQKLINNSKSYMSYEDRVNIEIPDKYNTGLRNKNISKYVEESNLGGIKYIVDKRGTKPIILLRTADLNAMSGNYLIENIDFTGYTIRLYTGNTNNKVVIKFNNCKFDELKNAHNQDDDITVVVEHSQLIHVDGSNITINYSQIGGGSSDGINPFKNFYVNNSYIRDISGYTTGGEAHYDGMQIYGSNTDTSFLCHDVHFYNTRFELPYIIKVVNGVPSTSYVNAPIMVQLEFNNATNISFNKIYVNGGGYTIYNHAVKGTSMYKVSYKDIYVGYGGLYGIIYPMQQSDVDNSTFNNIGRYDSLMVSSVFKDSKGVHVITTNDTLVERKLTCVANNQTYNFNVPAHPKLSKATATQYSFDSLPYDIDYTIKNTSISNISCYDTTNTTQLNNDNLIKTKRL